MCVLFVNVTFALNCVIFILKIHFNIMLALISVLRFIMVTLKLHCFIKSSYHFAMLSKQYLVLQQECIFMYLKSILHVTFISVHYYKHIYCKRICNLTASQSLSLYIYHNLSFMQFFAEQIQVFCCRHLSLTFLFSFSLDFFFLFVIFR